VVTIQHALPHSPRIAESATDCRTRQTVCRVVSYVCVCKRKQKGIIGCGKKALRIYRQQVASGGLAKAFIHNIHVDRSGINFLQILFRHDFSVSFPKKYINKFLIDVPYG